MRFHLNSLAPVAFFVAMLFAAPASAVHVPKGDPEAGKVVYEQTCIACHGGDGRGAIEGMPTLDKHQGPLGQPDDVVMGHIMDGFESGNAPMAMPPMGGNPELSESDIADVLAYMRDRFLQ